MPRISTKAAHTARPAAYRKQSAAIARARRTAQGVRGRAALLLALWAVLLLAGACSTARERTEPDLLGSLRMRDAQTHAYFNGVYRSGNFYQDFRPKMVVDAIFLDLRYRELYVDTLAKRYLLPEPQTAQLRKEQAAHFDGAFELLVFLYDGSSNQVKLSGKDPAWRLFLRDDDGDLLEPMRLERIKPGSATYTYIDTYFYGLDRWASVYRVAFPKLAKTLTGQSLGESPIELVVTGVLGTVTLRWEDPALFYRPAPEGDLPSRDAPVQAAASAAAETQP